MNEITKPGISIKFLDSQFEFSRKNVVAIVLSEDGKAYADPYELSYLARDNYIDVICLKSGEYGLLPLMKQFYKSVIGVDHNTKGGKFVETAEKHGIRLFPANGIHHI